MRWSKALIQDVRFQWRHGFYAVYAIISTLYILFLRFVPEKYQEDLTITILYSDPSFLGFYFVGGIVLLEKVQKILQPLWVTPLRLSEYLSAKLVSLAFLSSLSSMTIAMGVHGFSGKSLLMVIGIFFSSICFTCWGMILVVHVQTINAFLVGSQVFLLPIALPLLGYWGLAGGLWADIWPGSAAFSLLEWALSKPFVSFPLRDFLLLIAWCAVSFYGAKRSLFQAFTKEWGGVRA
ncbi:MULTISPECIES: ABC transporter permease [unclassified Thermoactinomyces]|jgi:fluoroquinolone transport system permease protein|uniref:fluoroquinolone export ABC transporter permease subunit n=1 Tax=unclassified Thermoactinomyces TaxID=2634588 RepID=UPI0018DDA11A|nr:MULTISPECIES: ABC transporter permease [unclassified Thermoactinomyces]MBH8597696.1 ABC transporter permease [Thermoactinomyces sp. CICC 10523]MBH8604036.1 ABC transporter permease [Thermoactinomyces sp. CICC 10522]MBH8606429.1 ABC transporter permease [Thermoactinomyces sp. CICC 10521]